MLAAIIKKKKYCLHSKPDAKEIERITGFCFLIEIQDRIINKIVSISVNTQTLNPTIYGCKTIKAVVNKEILESLNIEKINL